MLQPQRLPFTVISRYVLREFFNLFALTVAAFSAVYVIVDFFDRLGKILANDASASAALRFLLFKLPLIITQVIPPAVLAAVLVSLGMLGRRNELIALRASGVSLLRIALPLLGAATLISVAVLGWNETVVPYATHRSQDVNLFEIRRQARPTMLSDREIWYHGADGFYNIDHVDRARQTLYGVVIYRVSPEFQLQNTVEIKEAHWAGDHWKIPQAVERRISDDGDVTVVQIDPSTLLRHEQLADFLEVYREPEEMSYAMLRERILALTRKGIDAGNYLVDLHLKLAVPFASLVLAALGIPIAGRLRRHVSVASVVGIGIAVGFSYWVILALGMSLGKSGVLPPFAAAWSANIICSLAAVFLFLSAE